MLFFPGLLVRLSEEIIHAAYPLSRATAALAAVAGRVSAGKVLIVPDCTDDF